MTMPMPTAAVQPPQGPSDPLSEMGLAAPPSPALQSLLLGPQSVPGAVPQPSGAEAAVAGQGSAGAPAPMMPPPSMQADATAYDPEMMKAVDIDIRQEFEQRHGRQPTQYEVNAVHALPLIEMNLGRKPTRAEMLQYLSARSENPLQQQPMFAVDTTGTMGAPGAGA